MISQLYEPFKPWSSHGSVYILSDTHFSDSDCKLMDPNWISPEEQVKIINDVVMKTDTLVLLGDVGDISYIPQIRAGHKVLILGNHDKGASNYKRQITEELIDLDPILRNSEKDSDDVIREMERKGEIDYYGWQFHSPFEYGIKLHDNGLFDEVYEGPLFIGPKLLLSHEPVSLPFCVNIHGHDHNGAEHYEDGCIHVNLAANVCNFTPWNLGKAIKKGLLSNVDSIHRMTIDRQSARKEEGR